MEKSMLEEIKGLIQSGFDSELIAFELDIPLEEVLKLKKQMEEPKKNSPKTEKVEIYSYYKMTQMKEKYREIFYVSSRDKNDSKKEHQETKQLAQKDNEVIQTVIQTIETKINSMKNLQKSEKRAIVKEILNELKKISKYQLTMEQIEQLNMLISSEELQNLGMDNGNIRTNAITNGKRKLTMQLVQAVKIKLYETDDIETLRELEKKFINFETKGNQIEVDGIKREISAKISKIQQQSTIDKLRSNVSPSIELVITDLINGNIDIQRANTIIGEEAKKRVEGKPKTRFSLTEEQEKGQIIYQIRTAIIEKADKYPIQNPEQALRSIQQLCGGELGFNIRTVVSNLIARKDYEAAKSICNKFSGEKVENEVKAYIKVLRDEIRNAEISDFVLAGINQEQTAEEEAKYFELIKQGLEMGNVKLSSISLGKNIDGSRKITLADIWPEQIQR